jgi:hypothetical protein
MVRKILTSHHLNEVQERIPEAAASAAACLCPAAIAGAVRGSLFPPRHALEQEVLRHAEL